MRQVILFIICTVTILVSNNTAAQDSMPRTSMSMMKFKVLDKDLTQDKRIYTQDGLKMYKEISLKNTSTKLNLIETNLLKKYSDVIVNKLHRQYFILNEKNHIGIADVYGNELIPPIDGNVRYFGTYMLFGESTDDFDLIDNEYVSLISKNSSFNLGFSLGICKAIVKNTMSNELDVIIPYGKYDCISIIPMSLQFKIRGFYVGKLDRNNNLQWGACDEFGNEIIECKYKSIYFDGSHFNGSNTKTMNDWNEYYANQLGLKQELQNQRRQIWSSVLNSFSATIANITNIENASNNQQTNTISTINTKNGNEQSASGLIARNSAYKAYEGYANELIKMQSGVVEYNNNKRIEFQSKMKDIRKKWENEGYQFTKLGIEDWSGL